MPVPIGSDIQPCRGCARGYVVEVHRQEYLSHLPSLLHHRNHLVPW
jgi:hypothetical protein